MHNSKLTGVNDGNKFLHLVHSDDCGDSIFLDFDRKMGKEKRYETNHNGQCRKHLLLTVVQLGSGRRRSQAVNI